MGNKRVSDVMDYEKHIAPYRIIDIIAGVGAGKNYWTDEILINDYRVLIITSRKSKKQEIKNKKGIRTNLDLSNIKVDSLKAIWSSDCKVGGRVCNNWDIACYMNETFMKDDKSTHLWQYFDIIILDEAHSLATDATYSEAPFQVLDFIKAAYLYSDVKIILMTGTHRPIDNLIRLKNKKEYILYDLRDECTCIEPDKLEYISKECAVRNLVKHYRSYKDHTWRAVYFANTLDTIRDYIIPFLVDNGVPEECIAVSHSQDPLESGISTIILNNQFVTSLELSREEDLPPYIKIFITTSKNKEGINIKNDEYDWDIYIESQWEEEQEQMWGRVREGNRKVFLIYDAKQHPSVILEKDLKYKVSRNIIDGMNDALNEWSMEKGIPLKNRMHVHAAAKEIKQMLDNKMTIYVQYSMLTDKFEMYRGKMRGVKSFKDSAKRFKDFVEYNLAGEHPENPFGIEYIFHVDDDARDFKKYLKGKKYPKNHRFTVREQNEMFDFINDKLLLRQKSDKLHKYKTLGSAVKNLGYTLEKVGKNKDRAGYGEAVLRENE